ncbi:Carbon storage regulator [uncultured Caudovirales phage]|uniref:Carbon storage regulator n=1 Tax=uncultured Caudovirales phage TaxID=2100421 RepID=A0A6J5P1G3_9CAUD|nr:Carbon storage regulator [uncultured Caudovirales phage]
MLILTRKRGESVDLVYENKVLATITVLGLLPSGVVRIGFNALPEIRVKRDNMVSDRDWEDDNVEN